ncbi:hypothetical protein AHAS_Ahas07G0055100 [Arachis hypogaea]
MPSTQHTLVIANMVVLVWCVLEGLSQAPDAEADVMQHPLQRQDLQHAQHHHSQFTTLYKASSTGWIRWNVTISDVLTS